MGHALLAVVAPKPINTQAAAELDLTVLDGGTHVIVPLYHRHLDAWTEKLGLAFEHHSQIIGDTPVLLHFAKVMGLTTYALVQTEYFGGTGTQFATVWESGVRTMPAKEGNGVINSALERIGVVPRDGKDAFDTIGLGTYRDGSVYFGSYWD
jgi:hypothetical protein